MTTLDIINNTPVRNSEPDPALDPPRPPRKKHMLLWLDTETTGLDPYTCELLEVGMQVTDMRGETSDDSLHLVVHPDNVRSWVHHPELLTAYAMHTSNGLMAESAEAPAEGYDYKHTAWNIREFINDMTDRYILHPAGTNVDFDLRQLDVHLSKFVTGPITDGLSHRKLDLSSFRLKDLANGIDYYRERQQSTHRTDWCINRDITEYHLRLTGDRA